MSNLTAGQIVGGIIGAVVGFVYGGGPVGAVKGAALGLSLGGYVDPPTGPTMRGPTLEDLSFQSASYGVVLPRLYGRIAVSGNIFYLENNKYKAVTKSDTVGGKGGGGQKVVTTTYYATFAVALGATHAGSEPYRVWAGGKLIIGAQQTGIQNLKGKPKKPFDYRYYDGTQTTPDPRMEAVLGVGNAPSYEGTAYIIFYDFELTNYGNGLAGCPIKVELFLPDAAAQAAQRDISTFAVQTEEDFIFPDDIDNTVGCAIAVYQGGRNAVHSASSGNTYYHRFGTISGVGSANDIYHLLIEAVYVHTNNAQSNAITWAFRSRFETPPVPSIIYTSIGNFPGPFPLDASDQEFAKLFAILSVEGINYAVYLLGSNTPPGFGLPANTLFVTLLQSSQILVVLGNFVGTSPINFAIASGEFYFLTTQAGPWVLKIFSLSSGALLSTHPITVPVSVNPDNLIAFAAEIYDGSYYCGGIDSGNTTLFAVAIDLTTFICTSKEVPIAVLGAVSQLDSEPFAGGGKAGQFSIYNGVIGICIFTLSGSLKHAHIYTFAPPVIDYEDPESNRISIIDIIEPELNAVGIMPNEYDLGLLINDTTIGYRVTQVTSARSAIGPIQSAYLFDLVEYGYKLMAVKRGTSSILTIPFNHLILSGDSVVKTEADSSVLMPSRLTLNYIDYDREFDAGSQYADHPAAYDSVETKDLPVVMQANEAAKLADIFLKALWVEVKKYQFSVPHTYINLLVGDVITVEVVIGKFVKMRIDQRSFDVSNIIQLSCTATSESSYTSEASGSEGESGSDIFIPVYADPIPIVLDIPLIREEQDVYGIAAVVVQEPPTTQSALLVSANDGQTFTEIGRFDGPGVVAQSSFDALGPGDQFVVERGTDLVLDNVINGEFFSVTYEAMLRNNNTIAYGQPGRWEILTYQDATPTVEGVTLSTFIRGKYGTEQYMDDHAIGDFVVLLDNPNTIFAPLSSQAVGLSWPIKAVNVGDDTEGGTLANYGTYEAVNLKPLSVVDPEVYQTGLDWTINFDPRTRYPSNQWVTGAIEQTDTEYWAIDVFNGASIVRTIQSATIPATYTEAQQIADFGSAQTTLTIDIYQVNNRVGRGYPLRVIA